MTDDDKFPLGDFISVPTDADEEILESESNDVVGNLDMSSIDNSQNTITVDELSMIREEVFKNLKELIPEQKFNTYFDQKIRLTAINGNTAVFNVPTAFIKSLITQRYSDQIEEAIVKTMGQKYNIEIEISEAMSEQSLSSNSSSILNHVKNNNIGMGLNLRPQDVPAKAESLALEHMNQQSPIGGIIDTNKRFENFIFGESNILAYQTALGAANVDFTSSSKYSSIYYYSDSGLGKTHLLYAIANKIRETHPEKVICYITTEQFVNELVHAITKQNLLFDFKKKYTDQVDVLLMDDIHQLSGKETSQEIVFNIFNNLYSKKKLLVFTSDKRPECIEGLPERLKTRFSSGLIVDIQPPGLETRMAILKLKAQEYDLMIDDDLLMLIARSRKTDIRSLEGILIRLESVSNLKNMQIDQEFVENFLKEDQESDYVPTLESIATKVSEHFKIEISDLKSPSRNKDIVLARHIAMYLSKKLIDSTNKDIAYFYNREDHSTVIHGVKKIKNMIKADANFGREVAKIENDV